MRANGCYLAPAAVLLIPAASTGVESFFGSVNFDFLSQSQDSWHLAYNSVNNVEPLFQRAIVPLNWSSGSGRFAISMLGAGTHGLLGSDMLRFNSALICAIVAAHSLALSAFVREIYGLRDLRAFTAVAIVLLSAGYTQGYFYYLLGQLSGLPLFVIALIWGKRFFEASEHPAREWLPKAIALAFILNSLFLFYPVLSGFAAAVLGGAAAAELVRTRASAHPRLRPWLVCFSIVTTTFLVVQIIVSDELQILRFWINVISGVQPSDAAAPVTVFTEYVTEQSFALALGLVNYPSSASALARWIEDEALRNEMLLAGGFLSIASLWIAGWRHFRFAPSNEGNLALALLLITSLCLFAFFATRSSYALFKLSSWFIPLLLPLFLTPAFLEPASRWMVLPRAGGFATLALNFLVAVTYGLAFIQADGKNFFLNTRSINGNTELRRLRPAVNSLGALPVTLALPNPFETAWVANEFRGREVRPLAHNTQVLDEVRSRSEPCAKPPPPLQGTFVISTNPRSDAADITPEPIGATALYHGSKYSIHAGDDIERLVVFGHGAFPVETIPQLMAKARGFPTRFRWVERGVEIFIYARRPQRVEVTFDLIPGYVVSPTTRRFIAAMDGRAVEYAGQRPTTTVTLDGMELRSGMNCIFVYSPDTVSPLPRSQAILRADIPFDGRFLNFGIGPLTIQDVSLPRP